MWHRRKNYTKVLLNIWPGTHECGQKTLWQLAHYNLKFISFQPKLGCIDLFDLNIQG